MELKDITKVKEIVKEIEDIRYVLEEINITSIDTKSFIIINKSYSFKFFRCFGIGDHNEEIKIPNTVVKELEIILKNREEELVIELDKY